MATESEQATVEAPAPPEATIAHTDEPADAPNGVPTGETSRANGSGETPAAAPRDEEPPTPAAPADTSEPVGAGSTAVDPDPSAEEPPAEEPPAGDAPAAEQAATSVTSEEPASIAELVKRLSEQASRLAHQEIELAKAELTLKGKRATIGAGAFGAAALVGLYAVGAIVAAAIILIGRAVTPWLAAVIVGVGLAVIAGVAAIVGLRKVKQAVPPVPQQAAESVKQDVEMARSRAQAGRS